MSSKVCIKDSPVEQLVKNPPAMQDTPVQFLGQEDQLEKGQATHSSILRLPSGSAVKESACYEGDLDSVPGLGRSPGDGNSYPLQYSGLENSTDYTESDTTERLSLHFMESQLQKAYIPLDHAFSNKGYITPKEGEHWFLEIKKFLAIRYYNGLRSS